MSDSGVKPVVVIVAGLAGECRVSGALQRSFEIVTEIVPAAPQSEA